MTIETLKAPNPRNRNGITVIKSNFILLLDEHFARHFETNFLGDIFPTPSPPPLLWIETSKETSAREMWIPRIPPISQELCNRCPGLQGNWKLDRAGQTWPCLRSTYLSVFSKFVFCTQLRDLSEISRGEGGGNFKFGFGNEVTHPCNGSEIC